MHARDMMLRSVVGKEGWNTPHDALQHGPQAMVHRMSECQLRVRAKARSQDQGVIRHGHRLFPAIELSLPM